MNKLICLNKGLLQGTLCTPTFRKGAWFYNYVRLADVSLKSGNQHTVLKISSHRSLYLRRVEALRTNAIPLEHLNATSELATIQLLKLFTTIVCCHGDVAVVTWSQAAQSTKRV
jgi:hypothetical protein